MAAILFVPPLLISGSPAYTRAIGTLDATLDELAELKSDELRRRIAEAQAALSELRDRAGGTRSDGEAANVPDPALAMAVMRVEAVLKTARETRMALARERRELATSLETALWELRRERGQLQDGAYGKRFKAHADSVFDWLTPYGLLAWAAFLSVVFFVPPSQLMKPFARITDRVRGLWVMGLRLELSETLIRNDKMEMQYAAQIMSSMITGHYLSASTQHHVDRLFRDFLGRVIDHVCADRHRLEQTDFRATLHVPFYFGREELFQLVNYYDHKGKQRTNIPGRGRVFSIRFGIVGRAWREEKARYDPAVSTHRDDLVKAWGMTPDEAEQAGRGRQTMLAVRLLDETRRPMAIVFMDAKDPMVFSTDEVRQKDNRVQQRSAPSQADYYECRDIDSQTNIERAEQLEQAFNDVASQELQQAIKAVRDDVGWDEDGRIFIGYR